MRRAASKEQYSTTAEGTECEPSTSVGFNRFRMSGMISAVVLAAGASSRMGRQKLLLPLAREPLVRRVVRRVSQAGFDEVLVVVGCEHEKVIGALEGLTVRHVINPDYETGMGSSFRAAVAALPDSHAAMFALADQPLLAAADYRMLVDTYRMQSAGSSACATAR
jgi:molybdenum cofactor cytidylyltransferase